MAWFAYFDGLFLAIKIPLKTMNCKPSTAACFTISEFACTTKQRGTSREKLWKAYSSLAIVKSCPADYVVNTWLLMIALLRKPRATFVFTFTCTRSIADSRSRTYLLRCRTFISRYQHDAKLINLLLKEYYY